MDRITTKSTSTMKQTKIDDAAAAAVSTTNKDNDNKGDDARSSSNNNNNNNNSTNNTVGLALCGGIFVAAAGGAAVMRAFQQQMIQVQTSVDDGEEEQSQERPAMEAFDYISGLSGGIVPTVLYAYAQNVDTDELLDAKHVIQDPSQITKKLLNRGLHRKSMHRQLTRSVVTHLIPRALYTGVEALMNKFRCFSKKKFSWASAMFTMATSAALLQPFGIKTNRFFGTVEERKATLDKKMIVPRDDVKAEILINFVMAGRAGDLSGNGYGVEFTKCFLETRDIAEAHGLIGKFMSPPDVRAVLKETNNVTFIPFTASSTEVGTHYSLLMNTSLGALDTFSLQGFSKHRDWGVDKDNHFSLELALAMGTNFLSITAIDAIPKAKRDFKQVQFFNKMFSQKRRVKVDAAGEEMDLLFVDGGLVDGLGVPALVQRKTRHIISSIWPHGPERKYSELYSATKNKPTLNEWLMSTTKLGLSDVAAYFGFYKGERTLLNHIFDDGEFHLQQLRTNLDALYAAGKPLITTLKDIKVIDNPYWGTEAGQLVDLTIIYYTVPTDFANQISHEAVPPPEGEPMFKDGSFTNKHFKEFPNFAGLANFETKTKTWGLIKQGNLSKKQVNMMNYLASWMINESWDGIKVDGIELFGGFRDILSNKKVIMKDGDENWCDDAVAYY